MNLVLDFGNTFTKAALVENGELHSIITITEDKELESLVESKQPTRIACVSVTKRHEPFLVKYPSATLLSPTTKLPISNNYSTPLTLGMDRLAGVCGAHAAFPGSPCLVIDAGTCITLDFLDAARGYIGGVISPGVHMRYKAMNNFTSALPLVEEIDVPEVIGATTRSSMQSGVINGVIFEMQGFINELEVQNPGMKVLVTGGDAQVFESKLKGSIFVRPNLVLEGLNSIVENL